MLVAFTAWAFSSPVGSSPDDDFHLPSIWCGLGDRAGICEPSGNPDSRLVPAGLVGEPCYARDANVSASCWQADGHLKETERVNVGALYPPLFYATMSVFASPNIVASVIAMRMFNAALFTGLVTACALLLPADLRRLSLLPLAVTMVPLGLFIVPSTNASSWAVLSAGVLWVSLYGASRTDGRRRVGLLVLALLAGVLGAGARADAAAFAALGAVVALLLVARRDKSLLFPLIVAGVILLISAAFYLSAGQSAAVTDGLDSSEGSLSGWQLIDNFLGVPGLWLGIFGAWGLGWLDTRLPAAVSVLGFAVFALAAAMGLQRLNVRKTISLALMFVAFWMVPFVLLWQSQALVGTQVQPRYILPLAIILIGVALVPVGRGGTRPLPWGIAITGIGFLGFANAVALHIELNRYTTGVGTRTLVPGQDAEWWWNGGVPPWAVWIIGSLALVGALISLVLLAWLQSREASVLDTAAVAAKTA